MAGKLSKTLNADGYFSIYAGDQHSTGIQLKEVEPKIDVRAFEQEQKEVKSPKHFLNKRKSGLHRSCTDEAHENHRGLGENEEESLISHYTDHLRRLQEDMAEKQ